jgi:hypothetical protein
MKKFIAVFSLVFSTAVMAVDSYVFSKDGLHAGSSPRALPVQAVDLATGKVIVGLHSRDDVTIAGCGWYKLVPGTPPQTYSNEYAKVVGYTFSATTCTPAYEIYWHPVVPRTFSKLDLITVLKQMGKWDAAKAFIQASGYEDEWIAAQDLVEDNAFFTAAVDAVVAQGIVTRAEVNQILYALSNKKPGAFSAKRRR